MFLPPTIDLENSQKYILSLRIHPEHFMFSLFKPGEGKNYCLRGTSFAGGGSLNLLANVRKIIFELNFLTQQYAATNVVFVTPEYTLVPSEFVSLKTREELLAFTSHEDADKCALSHKLPRYDAELIYRANKELHEFLSRSLYNPQFYQHTALLAELFEGRSKTTSLFAKMYINLKENMLDIIVFDGNKILHTASYENLTKSEKAYYILKTWESLELTQMTDQLLIAGELDDEVLTLLREYVKNIERVASPSEIYLWHKEAQQAPLDLIYLSL